MINVNKVDRLFTLQEHLDRQVSLFGEVGCYLTCEIEQIVESLTLEEQTEITRRFHLGR